jgi:hypothetical protein
MVIFACGCGPGVGWSGGKQLRLQSGQSPVMGIQLTIDGHDLGHGQGSCAMFQRSGGPQVCH